jgi:hypothetical protein
MLYSQRDGQVYVCQRHDVAASYGRPYIAPNNLLLMYADTVSIRIAKRHEYL